MASPFCLQDACLDLGVEVKWEELGPGKVRERGLLLGTLAPGHTERDLDHRGIFSPRGWLPLRKAPHSFFTWEAKGVAVICTSQGCLGRYRGL